MGLEFEKAITTPEPGMVPLRAPQQVLISLKKFARVCKDNVREERPAYNCLLYTSPSPRDRPRSRMPSSA